MKNAMHDTIRRRGRQGFTIAEMMVALVIFGLILAGVWTLYASARRSAHKADVRLQGIKTALFLLQPLEQDFRRVYIDPKHPIEINPEGRQGLQFMVFDRQRSDLNNGQLLVTPVTYTFSPSELAVYRQEGNGKRKRIPGIFENFVCRLHPTPPYLTMPPYTNTLEGKPTYGGLVTYMISCLPIEFAKVPPSRWKAQDRTTITGSLFPTVPLGKRKYHFWAWNPTSQPRN